MGCSPSQVKETNLYRMGKYVLRLQHIFHIGKTELVVIFAPFLLPFYLNLHISYITPIKCSILYFELILKYLANYELFEGGKSKIHIWANLRMIAAS